MTPPRIPAGFTENTGEQPARTKGKRVIVQLFNGSICGTEPVTTVSPKGWAADGPQKCRWSLTPGGFDFDIRSWRVA